MVDNYNPALYSGALGKTKILEAINRGDIKVFRNNQTMKTKDLSIDSVTLDLTLGRWIYYEQNNLFIDIKDQEFLLNPGKFILVHTHEYISLRFLGLLSTPSTVARKGLDIHRNSNLVKPCPGGCWYRLTLEIHNGSSQVVKLKWGDIIASMRFETIHNLQKEDLYRGTYLLKNTNDWKREMMLPKDHPNFPKEEEVVYVSVMKWKRMDL